MTGGACAIASVVVSLALMAGLPRATWERLVISRAIGLAIHGLRKLAAA